MQLQIERRRNIVGMSELYYNVGMLGGEGAGMALKRVFALGLGLGLRWRLYMLFGSAL